MENYLEFAKHVAGITHLFGGTPYLIDQPDETESLGNAIWLIDSEDEDDGNEMSLHMHKDGTVRLLILSLECFHRAKLYTVIGYCASEGIRCRILDGGGATIHPAEDDLLHRLQDVWGHA